MRASHKPHVIVVGVDFTDTSRLALLQGWQLATQRTDAELHLVHVIRESGGFITKAQRLRRRERMLEDLPARMRNYAVQLAQQFHMAPLRNPLAVHVRIGRPARQILELAVELDAAMIVVGSHARRGLDRLVTASVADQLVHAGRLPVLVSRPKRFEGIVPGPEAPEPPCPDCVEVRRASGDPNGWCARHDREHVVTHTYSWTRGGGSKPPHDAEGAMRSYR